MHKSFKIEVTLKRKNQVNFLPDKNLVVKQNFADKKVWVKEISVFKVHEKNVSVIELKIYLANNKKLKVDL